MSLKFRDVRKGRVTSGAYTVNTTATIAIPAWASGIKVYPLVNNVRFAFGEAPAAIGSDTQAVGGFALANTVEARTFLPDSTANVQLLSTASTVVWVEFFGGA